MYSLQTHMRLYLGIKFQVSSIVLTTFRQGSNNTPFTVNRTPKTPAQIRVKEMSNICKTEIICQKQFPCYLRLSDVKPFFQKKEMPY